MPTTPGPSAAQEILRIASVGLLLVGGVAVSSGLGVLKRRRGAKLSKPSSLHLAVGIVMLAGGMTALAFRREPAPEPEIITPEQFSSRRVPTLSVVAPPPWRLEHDEEAGRLAGQRPGVRLMIETTYITDTDGARSTVNGVVDTLRRSGLAPMGEPFAASFDGLQAVGTVGTAAAASMAFWVVERPGKLFTIIVCTSDTGPDAQTACDPVLSTLKWRTPGPR